MTTIDETLDCKPSIV